MTGSEQIAPGFVRVWGDDNRAVGAGFLIGARTIVTCAHVPAIALGVSEADLSSCERPLSVDFALLAGAAGARLRARLVFMPPVPGTAGGTGDLAVLELDADPPLGAAPLPLSADREIGHHRFRTFGFPPFSPDGNGDWAEGVIEGTGSANLVQMRSTSRQGRRIQRGFSGAPVWDAEAELVVGMIVKADRAGDDRVAYAIPAWDLSAAMAGRTGMPRCPYRGLESFGVGDAELFFGRDEFVARLVRRVRERPILAVIGPSGAGKSSVIAAGLAVHYLASPDWQIVLMRPGRHPFRELAHAVMPVLEPGLSRVERLDKAAPLAGIIREEGLRACLGSALDAQSSLLVVIDQFEELFTISDGTDVESFIETIVQSADEHGTGRIGDLCIVLAMRTEFLAAALDYPGLANAINPAEVLGGMTAGQLRRVIEDPVRGSGVKLADGLADRIIYDAPNNSQLPLVEFLLTSLWAHRDNSRMTHSAYQQLGGVGGALAQHAELVFARLSQQDQERVKPLLIRLVTARIEDTPVTCRVADRGEFDAESWRLVQHLADRRLLLLLPDLAGSQTVQVVHEALTTKWERFAGWIAEERKDLVTAGEVRDAAARWTARNRDPSWLLRGEALAEAAAWAEDASSADPVVLEFIARSLISEVPDEGIRRGTGDYIIQLTERIDNIPLRVASLDRVMQASINNFQPFITFGYWRRLWQYEEAMRGQAAEGESKEWNYAVNSIRAILLLASPIIAAWLLSWFCIARFAADDINFRNSQQIIATGTASSVVLVAFWCVRRAFRHPVLILPMLLAASMFTTRIPFWGKPVSPRWITSLEWEAIYVAITAVIFAIFFFYLVRKYRLARKERNKRNQFLVPGDFHLQPTPASPPPHLR